MATVPEFYPGNEGQIDFPRDRFLEHTDNDLINQFQSLDQNAITKLKQLPTLFAAEHEKVDTRIGKITNIEVHPHYLRIKYKFDDSFYPLTKGILQKSASKLSIDKDSFEFYRTHWAVKKCDISDFYEKYLKSLTGIAHQLKDADKKVQLIYAFNGTGKTRLSRELKEVVAPKNHATDPSEFSQQQFLYYNAFTEDLFYWDNDLDKGRELKFKIQPNKFTNWILKEIKDEGLEKEIAKNFQRHTDEKLNPQFNAEYKTKNEDGKEITVEAFSEVTFSYQRGDDSDSGKIKISKGEESNFIWSIFYTLLQQIINVLNDVNSDEQEETPFDQLEYVFIDDPVSSLDENHLIELAVNLARLIKDSPAHLKFVITTHNPLFYNVLHHELKMSDKNKKDGCYFLERLEDGTFNLDNKSGSANKSFSYHLHIKKIIETAYAENKIEKYHFMLLRNLYEKTCGFLGYKHWTDLLPEDARDSYKRLINTYSHKHLSYEEKAEPTTPEKQTVKFLLDHLKNNYGYLPNKEDENAATN